MKRIGGAIALVVAAMIVVPIVLDRVAARSRNERVAEKRSLMNSLVEVGDDIREAKTILEENGFRIDYGPDSPTRSNKYLMMTVDFGEQPTTLESLHYTADASLVSGGSLDGIIKSSPTARSSRFGDGYLNQAEHKWGQCSRIHMNRHTLLIRAR